MNLYAGNSHSGYLAQVSIRRIKSLFNQGTVELRIPPERSKIPPRAPKGFMKARTARVWKGTRGPTRGSSGGSARPQRFMELPRVLRKNIFLVSRECDLLDDDDGDDDSMREAISRATNCEMPTRNEIKETIGVLVVAETFISACRSQLAPREIKFSKEETVNSPIDARHFYSLRRPRDFPIV